MLNDFQRFDSKEIIKKGKIYIAQRPPIIDNELRIPLI